MKTEHDSKMEKYLDEYFEKRKYLLRDIAEEDMAAYRHDISKTMAFNEFVANRIFSESVKPIIIKDISSRFSEQMRKLTERASNFLNSYKENK